MEVRTGPAGMPSAWGVRLAMASRGWISSTRLATGGDPREPFFQIWFSRWDWHGRRCDKVTMHSGCPAPLVDRSGTLGKLGGAVRRAAARALDAWEKFPDSIPQQDGAGFREEPIGTRVIFRESTRQADHILTERLPADATPFCDMQGGDDATLGASLDFAAAGLDHEDDLTWMWRTPGERRTDRIWGLDYRVTARDWHGERVMPNRLRFGCDALAESLVVLSLAGTLGAIAGLRGIYRPGGPLGNIPPGFERLSDAILAKEIETREKDARNAVRLGLISDDREGESAHMLEDWTNRWRSSKTLRERLVAPTAADVAAALAEAVANGPPSPGH